MSADFWAGYISGAVGIIIGNPLDIVKVRLQAQTKASSPRPTPPPSATIHPPSASSSSSTVLSLIRKFSTGTAAPILGYGALNALLFVSYNRSEALLNQAFPPHPISTSELESVKLAPSTGSNLVTTFLAGAIGGLATWVVSTPTELIKCRSQLAPSPAEASSWNICKRIWRSEGGVRGLYFGGTVTAVRDSIGYGFYFLTYELSTRYMERWLRDHGYMQGKGLEGGVNGVETTKVLLCGGLAGVATWVSIFPLDVIKTRVQAQVYGPGTRAVVTGERMPLIGAPSKRMDAVQIAKEAYREAGLRVFFRGLMVCSVRAFIVNAVQWAAYEWIMRELGQGREQREPAGA